MRSPVTRRRESCAVTDSLGRSVQRKWRTVCEDMGAGLEAGGEAATRMPLYLRYSYALRIASWQRWRTKTPPIHVAEHHGGVALEPPELRALHRGVTERRTIPLVVQRLSLIHISEPTRRTPISYAVFCLKKK